LAHTILVVLIAIGLIALAALTWALLGVFLLLFGAILAAVILHTIAAPIARLTHLSRSYALALAGILILAVAGGTVWFFQAQVQSQFAGVLAAATTAIPKIGQRIGMPEWTREMVQSTGSWLTSGAALGRATSIGMTFVGAITSLVLVLFGGVYLAAEPDLYRMGFVKLLPAGARGPVGDTLDVAGRALKLWFLGQLVAMAVTGSLTGLAMWAIGVPSPLALGLIAAVTEFIPLIGPFIGAAPALLIGFSQGVSTFLWVAGAFLVIQQVESNLIQPLITNRAVSIPPALLLFSVIAFGTLFGLLGIVLAAPLTVCVYVAVAKLYVRRMLGEPTQIPGEKSR
jgi:predicted PurR-regulated permease PerM